MTKYSSTSIKSKWVKTKWLVKDAALKRYVPETRLFSMKELDHFVKQYKMVYFKPTNGTGGQNIARIVRKANSTYQIRKDFNRMTASSLTSLHEKLKKIAKGKSYLLQRGIYLKNSKNRPFDLRVMMQKTKADKWVTSVIFAKLGRSGKVVTNYHQGGEIVYLEEALRGAGYSKSQIAAAESVLRRMGLNTGKCFDRRYKGFRELGLDVAIDKDNRYWILEVNTRPSVYPLKYLKNKSLYQNVVKYGKGYGRF